MIDRKPLLIVIVAMMSIVGLGLFLTPFFTSLGPSAPVQANAPQLPYASIPAGELSEIEQNGRYVFVYRDLQDKFMIFAATNTVGYYLHWNPEQGRSECMSFKFLDDEIHCMWGSRKTMSWNLLGKAKYEWAPDLYLLNYTLTSHGVRYSPNV